MSKVIHTIAPYAGTIAGLSGVGLPLAIGIGAGGGLLGGGGLKGALGGALGGAATGGGGALLGGGLNSSLGLGLSNAAATGIGGGLIGATSGGLSGGLKGALINGALSGVGSYAGAGGFDGALSDTLGGTWLGRQFGVADPLNAAYSPGAVTSAPLSADSIGVGTVPGVGTGAASSSYSSGGQGPDWLDRNIGGTWLGRQVGAVDPANYNYSPGAVTGVNLSDNYNEGLVSPDNKLINNSATELLKDRGGSTSINGNEFLSKATTPLLSAAVGAYTNNQATQDLVKAQKKNLNMIQPYLNEQFNPTDLANDPGYQFQLAQGQKAIGQRQAATGNYFSGQALKDATDYSQGLADQTYGNAYQRWLSTQGQKLGAIGAATGFNDAKGNANAAGTVNMGNLLSGSGAALLGGQGISNTGNLLGQNSLGIDPAVLAALLKRNQSMYAGA